jgi:hypothetical protein
MKRKLLFLLVLIIPFLQGCNSTDDLQSLLVGKTWRLSSFYDSDGEVIPYDGAAELLQNNPESFVIKFNENTFSGKALNKTFSGTWKGDGNTNTFSFYIDKTGGSDSEKIAIDFFNAIKDVGSYRNADENNLELKFSEGSKFMRFYVKK